MTDDLRLSFGDVEKLLMHLHAVPGARRMTLRSRIQHLQRSNIPPSAGGGRGSRTVYGVDETFQMVLAMKLAALNWSSQSISRIVIGHWGVFRVLVDLGIATSESDDSEAPAEYALIHPDGLAPLRGDQPGISVEIASGDALAARAVRAVQGEDGYIFIDVVSLVRRSMRYLRARERSASFDPGS